MKELEGKNRQTKNREERSIPEQRENSVALPASFWHGTSLSPLLILCDCCSNVPWHESWNDNHSIPKMSNEEIHTFGLCNGKVIWVEKYEKTGIDSTQSLPIRRTHILFADVVFFLRKQRVQPLWVLYPSTMWENIDDQLEWILGKYLPWSKSNVSFSIENRWFHFWSVWIQETWRIWSHAGKYSIR